MSLNTPRGYTYPVYSDLADFPAQIQDLAQDIDADIDSLYDRLVTALNQPAARVSDNGVTQAVANNTNVTATFGLEEYDNAAMVNLGVSTSIVNIVETGVYYASGSVVYANNGNPAGGICQLSLVSSGALGTIAARSQPADAAVATAQPNFLNVTNVFFAASGTTLTMVMRQTTGASMNATGRQLGVAKLGVL